MTGEVAKIHAKTRKNLVVDSMTTLVHSPSTRHLTYDDIYTVFIA